MRVDFTLQTGVVSEEIVVTAQSPLLQTGSGTVGETLKSETIENLPVNGRDYTVLARLTTGVVPPQQGARAELMFAANGVRPAQNNYLLDGIDNNTSNVDFLSGVAYVVKPPIDAVDEIKILTSSFSAEYGRAGGAVLNTTLKSGSNKLRGSVWEFNRNDALNENDFFAKRAGVGKAKYNSNQFGLTGGGPIIPSKTFWFGDYEGSLITQGRTWVRTVPTAAQRQSGFTDFSDLISLQSGTVGADVLGRSFPRGTVFDPATTRQLAAGQVDPLTGMVATRAGFVRDAFPGNRIPVGRISADALKLMNLYPAPNQAGPEQQLRREPRQQGRHARLRRPRRSQLQHQRSLLRALQLLEQPQAQAVAVRWRCRRRRFRRRRREGARPRLRGEPHARAFADADQRGAVRHRPRAHLPAPAQRRRHEQCAGALRDSRHSAAGW